MSTSHAGVQSPSKKRLVVCFDGTWNTPDKGKQPTNVVKLMRAVRQRDKDGVAQVVFYDAGVGTGGKLDKLLGGMVGEGLEENVKDGYRFLANNYELNDEVYIFGFSRGAYTARSLGGFLDAIGLLRDTEMHHLNEAWDLYRTDPNERKKGETGERLRQIQTLCYGQHLEPKHEVRVRVLGVWDTVGALGIPVETIQLFGRGRRRRQQFHNVALGKYIDNALHAVAIDEKRGPFYPTLWQRKIGSADDGKDQVVEQVWFVGAHSNIGGSYDDSRLSDIALDWMMKRVASLTELAFDEPYWKDPEAINPHAMGTLYESRSAMYFFSRVLPCLRLIAQAPIPKGLFRKALFWLKHRELQPDPDHEFPGEMVHQSVLDRLDKPAPFRRSKRARVSDVAYAPATVLAARDKLPVVGYDGEVSSTQAPDGLRVAGGR